MRFYLVDRVTEWEPNTYIEAYKLTSRNEEYWELCARGEQMPAALILEALCQACAWLVIASTDGHKRATLLTVGNVNFLSEVKPGDRLDIRGEVNAINEDTASVSGYVRVDNNNVLVANDILCALVDATALQAPDEFERLQALVFAGAAR